MLHIYLSALETEAEKLTFASVYEALFRDCYYLARSVTKSHEMAEDAVHNAFLSLTKHSHTLFTLGEKQRRSYVLTAVKNNALNLVSAKHKHTDPLDDYENTTAAPDLDLCEALENQETYEKLVACISALPEAYKLTFELRYIHEKNNQEIAETLGITNKAVSTRIKRAKNKIREMMGGVANE